MTATNFMVSPSCSISSSVIISPCRVAMTDSGERLAWRFSEAVVEEAARFKPGDPMIVIYRLIGAKDKRVTALAFPGSASTPTYVNTTGTRVELRSSPGAEVLSVVDVGSAIAAQQPPKRQISNILHRGER